MTITPGTPGKIAMAAIIVSGLTLSAPQIVLKDGITAQAAHHEKAKDGKDAKEEWAEAVKAIKGYSAAQRDKAAAQAEDLLTAVDSHIEMLESRTHDQWADLSEATRDKRRAVMRNLREKRSHLAEWYGGIKHSSGEAWDNVKDGFSDAYDSMADSLSDATDEF